jgi:hypothetical protein
MARLLAFVLAFTVGLGVAVTCQTIFSDFPSDAGFESQSGRSAVDSCHVHKNPLSRKFIPILAGVPGYPLNTIHYMETKVRKFPNSNFFIIDRSRSVTKGHVAVNVGWECRSAESAWWNSHLEQSSNGPEFSLEALMLADQ